VRDLPPVPAQRHGNSPQMGGRRLGPDARSVKSRHWLERERVLLYPSVLLLFLFLTLIGVATARTLPNLLYPGGYPLGNDFIGFWSATRLVAEGRPEAAYDESAVRAMHQVAVPGMIDFHQPWLNAPTFLLVLLPLGLVPYLPALGLFSAATVSLWAALVRQMFADPRIWVVAAAFPAGLLNFANGQSGFLTAGLAGFALLVLDRRPVLAGVPIGLLAIKPHLAVLFPLALLAARRWQTLFAAAATSVAFTLASVAVLGWATIPAFLHGLATVSGLFDTHRLHLFQMPSIYVSALSFGLTPLVGMVLHTTVALGAAACVWAAWRAETAPSEAKFATLSAASMLISPYIFFYDLTWTGLAIAWLVKLGLREGFRHGERELLAIAWICSAWVLLAQFSGIQLGWIPPFILTAMGTWCALNRHAVLAGGCPAALHIANPS
jgi:hypothetical protein